MINTPYTSELIKKGEMGEIKEVMEKGGSVGMQTFDQSLFELYKAGQVTLQNALANADSRGDLEWRINFGGGVKSFKKDSDRLQFPSEMVSLADTKGELDFDLTEEAGAAADAEHENQDASSSLDDLKPVSETRLDEES